MSHERDPEQHWPEGEPERELADWLEQAGAEQRSVLSAAAELDDVPGLGQVEAALGAARAEARAVRRRRVVLSVASLAAAVLLVLLLGRWAPEPDPGPTGVHLSSGALEIVAPREDQREWDAIEWNGPDGASFSVLVLNADGSQVLLEREGLRTTRLELEETQPGAWGGEVVILVQAHDETGRVIDSVERVVRRQD